MLRAKKFPWLSLTLLLVSYSTLGWVLAEAKSSLYTLLLAVALVLLFTEILAAPASNSRKFINRWLSSDSKAFVLILALAFFAGAIVVWIDIVAHIFVLMSAGLLARLDLHTTGLGQWQAFWILAALSLAGFTVGWVAHYYLYPLSG